MENNNEKLREKLTKLQALATNNPNTEEAKTAAGLLEKMLRENKLTEADISDNKEEFQIIQTGRLDIHDIAVAVVHSEGLDCYSIPNGKRRDTCVCFYANKVTAAEIGTKITFYCNEYKRQKEQFKTAFMVKNKLYKPTQNGDEVRPKSELTADDYEILRMTGAMRQSVYRKQIE